MPRFRDIPVHGRYLLLYGFGFLGLYTLIAFLQHQFNLLSPDVVTYKEPGNTVGSFSVRVYSGYGGGVGLCLMWLLFMWGVYVLPRRSGAWVQRIALALLSLGFLSLFLYPYQTGHLSSATTNSFWLSGSLRTQLYLDPLYVTALIIYAAAMLSLVAVYFDSHRYSQYYMSWSCPSCGYDLRGNMNATHCPECGEFSRHVIIRKQND